MRSTIIRGACSAYSASVVTGVNALVLAATTTPMLQDHQSLWIYATIACTGVARAFIGPSYNALFALVLPRNQYARAAGVGSSVFQFALVLGPALGGALVGWASMTAAYAVSAALALSAAITLLSLRIAEPPPAKPSPVFSSIGAGLRFVYGNQLILGAQALDMFAVLFGGAVAMLPAFVQDIFHYGPEGLGILRAAPAVGAILIGITLAQISAEQACGTIVAGGRRRIRHVHHLIRTEHLLLACGILPDVVRHFRWRVRGDADHHHAVGNTRCRCAGVFPRSTASSSARPMSWAHLNPAWPRG